MMREAIDLDEDLNSDLEGFLAEQARERECPSP
jgi:hypothetical protein